jgi:hypothetical protein
MYNILKTLISVILYKCIKIIKNLNIKFKDKINLSVFILLEFIFDVCLREWDLKDPLSKILKNSNFPIIFYIFTTVNNKYNWFFSWLHSFWYHFMSHEFLKLFSHALMTFQLQPFLRIVASLGTMWTSLFIFTYETHDKLQFLNERYTKMNNL